MSEQVTAEQVAAERRSLEEANRQLALWREEDRQRKIAAGIPLEPKPQTILDRYAPWLLAAAFIAACIWLNNA